MRSKLTNNLALVRVSPKVRGTTKEECLRRDGEGRVVYINMGAQWGEW